MKTLNPSLSVLVTTRIPNNLLGVPTQVCLDVDLFAIPGFRSSINAENEGTADPGLFQEFPELHWVDSTGSGAFQSRCPSGSTSCWP